MPDRSRKLVRHDWTRAAGGELSGLVSSQSAIGGEYPPVQILQLGSGLGAKLLDQQPPSVPVGGERLTLAAVAVEGQHEQAVEPLPQRMEAREVPQLRDDLGVMTEMQVGVDTCFQCLHPHFRQAGRFAQFQ